MNSLASDAPPMETAQVLLSLTKIKGLKNRKALDLFGAAADKVQEEELRDLFFSLASEYPEPQERLEGLWHNSVNQVTDCLDAGIQVIPYFDERYPQRLRGIADPPVVLFARGRVEALHSEKSVGIVGTRKPTNFGERAALSAGRLAAETGVAVVSGLALGCDAKAHEGCVEGEGTGVAVLAHGLDKVYPAANRDLADSVLEQGGCLVSEYPVGVKPARWAFAYRDRIQSGLSDSVLVIETDVKGGTMHTVNFSRQQQRPIACIDHPEEYRSMRQTWGNRKLIDEGTAHRIPNRTAFSSFLERIAASYMAMGKEAPPLTPVDQPITRRFEGM